MNTCDKDYRVVVAQGKEVYKAVVGALDKSNYHDIGTRTFPVLRVKIKGVVFQKGGCKYELDRRWVVVDGKTMLSFIQPPIVTVCIWIWYTAIPRNNYRKPLLNYSRHEVAHVYGNGL